METAFAMFADLDVATARAQLAEAMAETVRNVRRA